MKTLKKLLTEGLSSILYHSTDFNSLASILKNDRFRLTTSVGNPTEQGMNKKRDKLFYMSTTRSKRGGYGSDPYKRAVMIVLDGKKLSNNYTGNPVDYWGREWRTTDKSGRSNEFEDRIFTEKPFITNAKKYIKEIHVLFIEDQYSNDRNRSYFRKMFVALKKSKIPYYLYDDKKHYINQNKSKSVDLNIEMLRGKGDVMPSFGSSWDAIKPYLELHYNDREEKLSKEAKKVLNQIMLYNLQDAINALSADITNNKRGETKTANEVRHLIKVMRQLKLKTAQEYIIYLYDKWTKIRLGRESL